MSQSRVLDITAAAEYLSVGDDLIRELVKSGRLRRVMISQKKYLFDREDLDRLIESEKSDLKVVPISAPGRTGATRKKAEEPAGKWLEKYGVKR